MSNKKKKKRVRDLVEMLEEPEESRYIGEDKDQMDLYDEELARLEEEENEVVEEGFDEDDPHQV